MSAEHSAPTSEPISVLPDPVLPPDPALPITPITSLTPAAPLPSVRPQFGKEGGKAVGKPAVPLVILVAAAIVIAALIPNSPFAINVAPVIRTTGEVFFNAPSEARLVILVLLLVFSLNLIRLIQAERLLKGERTALEFCRQKISQYPDPLDARILQEALDSSPRDGALARAVQGVYDSRLMQTPDLSAITESVTQSEVSRSYQGRTTGNMLMLISLLGTVFGLAGTISNLKPQLVEGQRTGRLEDLLSNLEGTLTTMGTAFASTAWGILLAVISSAWANGVTRRREDLLADIERFAITELAPRLLPPAQTTVVEEMRRLVETSQQAVAHNQMLVLQVEATIKTTTEDLHRALVDAGDYVMNAGRASLDIAMQLDRILGQFPTDLENSLGTLIDGADELKAAAAQVTRTYSGLSDAVRQLEVALTEQKRGIETTIAQQRTHTDSLIRGQEQWMVSQRAAMEQQTRDLASTLSAQADTLQRRLDATTKEVANLIERIDPKLPSPKEWQDLRATLDQCRKAVDEFSDAARKLPRGTFGGGGDTKATVAIPQGDMDRLASTVGQSVGSGISQANDALRRDVSALQQQAQGIYQALTIISRSLEEIRRDGGGALRPERPLPPPREIVPPLPPPKPEPWWRRMFGGRK